MIELLFEFCHLNLLMVNPFIFILGTAVGSFLNVLIDRLPNEKKITGRSKCDHCRHKLAWYDLVPVLSFFLLEGKCRYCGKKLSLQYPLVEVLTGLMFVIILNFNPPTGGQISNYFLPVAYFGIISSLIVIFFADLKYQIIPDSMQMVFFVFSFFFHLISNFNPPTGGQISNFLISGLVVMLPILLLWLVTRGRGMGFGDVKLAFTIGFLLGIKAGFLALYFGFIIGAIASLFLIILKKKQLKSKIAFGPFLVLGILIMIFFQKQVFEIIKKIYGLS